jgi:aryl-alcohol dehydrogenase-like predicted oxidoreductase
MRFTPIPNTGLTPSALCLGTADFGGAIDRAVAFSILDAFIENGGNFIDTAKVYNDWIPGEASRSEKLVGAWMKERGNRSNVIIATKGAHPDLHTMHIPRCAPAQIISDLDASLVHLQIERIDLYYLHRDDPTQPVEVIIDTLYDQAKAGKIRYYACSNWQLERIQAAQVYAASRGIPGFAAVQNLWNLANTQVDAIGDPTIVVMDDALWQYQHQANLASIPFSSQANGVFQKLDAGGAESLSMKHQAMFLNPMTERRYATLQKLRAQTGLTSTQIVLGYMTSQPFPTIPIIGPRILEQLKDSLSAADIRLTEEQVAELKGSRLTE